MLVKIDF